MPDPFPVGVIESVGEPLVLQEVVSLLTQEQGLPSPAINHI